MNWACFVCFELLFVFKTKMISVICATGNCGILAKNFPFYISDVWLHKSEANTEVSFAFVHLDYIHRFAQQTNHPSNWLAHIVFVLSLLLSSFVHTNELSREFVLVQWFLVVRQQISDRNAEKTILFCLTTAAATWPMYLVFFSFISSLFVLLVCLVLFINRNGFCLPSFGVYCPCLRGNLSSHK